MYQASRVSSKAEQIWETEVLTDFTGFCSYDYEIWGNSPRFDLGILQDAYRALNMKIPWDFRKERDVRTLVSFIPEIKKFHFLTQVTNSLFFSDPKPLKPLI